MTGRDTGEIWIASPAEDVWSRLVTVAEIPTWYDDWDHGEADPPADRLRDGLTFRLRKGRSRRRTARCEVVTVEPHTRLRWIETLPHRAPVLVEFRLTPERDGTTVTHTKTVGRLRRVT